MALLRRWVARDTRSRRILLAFALYLVCGAVFAVVAGPPRLSEHTAYNHYALLADAWLHGRQDLPAGAPHYAGNNDFALFEGKTYISFPPFPAVLMLPLVKVAGSAENFQDGQFMVWLAGLGPALLFLVLEKLRRTGKSLRSETENILLSLLFAFGTVYFFTAVEGTVWFAAHVVAAALVSGYLLCSLDAERPVLAGLLIGCSFADATGDEPARRVLCPGGRARQRGGEIAPGESWSKRIGATWAKIDGRALARCCILFALPILFILALVFLVELHPLSRLEPHRLRARAPERRLARPDDEVGALGIPLPRQEPRVCADLSPLVPRARVAARRSGPPAAARSPPSRSTSTGWRSGSPRPSTSGSSARAGWSDPRARSPRTPGTTSRRSDRLAAGCTAASPSPPSCPA